MPNTDVLAKSKYAAKIPEIVRACEAIRKDSQKPMDVTFGEMLKEKYSLSLEGLYKDIGIDPTRDTIENIIGLPDPALRWLIPEIFRNAIRLGLRKNPIYPNLISAEQSVPQTTVQMPAINMSEAVPAKLGVGETITTGSVSFDQKSVSIHKIGRGIKIPYEVRNYVALNIVQIYMQDFGVKLGMGLDTMAISALTNGDQAGGGDSASVIGITTANALVWRDLLKIWIRLSRLGKTPNVIVAGEGMATDILDLFTNTRLFGTPRGNVTFKTPIPQNSDVYIHGAVADDQALIIDPSAALIKLNAQPLLVETEKIVNNQTEATYATLTTGFATIYRDNRLLLDRTKTFASFGFPAYMDPTSQEVVNFQ